MPKYYCITKLIPATRASSSSTDGFDAPCATASSDTSAATAEACVRQEYDQSEEDAIIGSFLCSLAFTAGGACTELVQHSAPDRVHTSERTHAVPGFAPPLNAASEGLMIQ